MGPYSAPGHAPCGLNPSRCPGLAGENAAVVTSPALSAAETGAAEALLACVWGPGTSVRAAEPIWDRTHVVRLHLAAGRSRLGSISEGVVGGPARVPFRLSMQGAGSWPGQPVVPFKIAARSSGQRCSARRSRSTPSRIWSSAP